MLRNQHGQQSATAAASHRSLGSGKPASQQASKPANQQPSSSPGRNLKPAQFSGHQCVSSCLSSNGAGTLLCNLADLPVPSSLLRQLYLARATLRPSVRRMSLDAAAFEITPSSSSTRLATASC